MSQDSSGEFAYIRWLRQQTPAAANVLVGPGDDCAVLVPPTRPQLITTDMLVEGSCFLLAEAGAFRVGRKAIAVNLSDIAAMAGRPTAAVVSVALPRDGGRTLAEELYRGMRSMADQFGVPIVGGDTNSGQTPLTISVTVLGEVTERGPVLRSGAKIGDWVFVTGPLGGSILGHHLDFTPRVTEALQLHSACDLHAMLDISDGLAKDLYHICEESACGAVLLADRIPYTDAARQLAVSDGVSPLRHALHDGEDFELVFTVSGDDGARLLREQPVTGVTLHHIGYMVEQGYWLEHDGQRAALEPRGYEHPV